MLTLPTFSFGKPSVLICPLTKDKPQFSIYYSGVDKRILVWDIAEGTLLTELKGHSDTVYSLSFSKDGNLLASGSFRLLRLFFD